MTFSYMTQEVNAASTKNYSVRVDDSENPTSIEKIVSPGQKFDVNLILTNNTSKKKTLRVSFNTAFTGDNGIVQYNLSVLGKKYFGPLDFNSMVSGRKTIVIQPSQQIKQTYQIKVPSQKFKGAFAGGFYVSESQDSSSSPGNSTINSKKATVGYKSIIAYVIPVTLRESTKIQHTKLILKNVKARVINGSPFIISKIANMTPTIFGKLNFKIRIINLENNRTIQKSSSTGLEMAPLSQFNYHIPLKKKIADGKYLLDLKARSGQRHWHFQNKFVINNSVAKATQNRSKNNTGSQANKLLIYILVGISIILLLLVTYVLGKYSGRKSKSKKDK
ncbi:DUF3324 domain-containing protein [Lactobacillus sp. UCMA15818]|uniref:DUF3324 domain-containing protein n=1 Tax=Lactobacillus sp. UCMA15818 TaxID=2583394 RepID=UPI0025AF048D|nr:DUF3324 domain-containing protein [Lactobacillus sp. UCMA15818]